jgi:hypothetical protein
MSSRELLLSFAKGGGMPRQSYLTFYHVTESGEVVVHSCERCAGECTLIRFCGYSNDGSNIEVSKEAIQAAIEAYLAKSA